MASKRRTPEWLLLFAALSIWAAFCDAYFADWSKLGGRPHEPTCVDIPKNMSLCSDIGYNKMRLPNLLDHDTLTEVQQQSGSWVPLRNVRCHPHTTLFLCSLFTPVCLESQIFPCRSLCNAVQTSCESRMRTYGYDWPEMLRCDRFPEDNDMCIKAPDTEDETYSTMDTTDVDCSPCNPVDTYENILDNFCRADTVLRGRVRRQRGKTVSLRKTKTLKLTESDKSKSGRRREKLMLEGDSECCRLTPGKQKYLIMGVRVENNLIRPTFVLPWRKNKSLRQAVRVFKSLRCDDPNLFAPTADDGTILPKADKTPKVKGRERKRKRKKNKRRKKDRGELKRRVKNKRRGRKNRKNGEKEEGIGKMEKRKRVNEQIA